MLEQRTRSQVKYYETLPVSETIPLADQIRFRAEQLSHAPEMFIHRTREILNLVTKSDIYKQFIEKADPIELLASFRRAINYKSHSDQSEIIELNYANSVTTQLDSKNLFVEKTVLQMPTQIAGELFVDAYEKFYSFKKRDTENPIKVAEKVFEDLPRETNLQLSLSVINAIQKRIPNINLDTFEMEFSSELLASITPDQRIQVINVYLNSVTDIECRKKARQVLTRMLPLHN